MAHQNPPRRAFRPADLILALGILMGTLVVTAAVLMGLLSILRADAGAGFSSFGLACLGVVLCWAVATCHRKWGGGRLAAADGRLARLAARCNSAVPALVVAGFAGGGMQPVPLTLSALAAAFYYFYLRRRPWPWGARPVAEASASPDGAARAQIARMVGNAFGSCDGQTQLPERRLLTAMLSALGAQGRFTEAEAMERAAVILRRGIDQARDLIDFTEPLFSVGGLDDLWALGDEELSRVCAETRHACEAAAERLWREAAAEESAVSAAVGAVTA